VALLKAIVGIDVPDRGSTPVISLHIKRKGKSSLSIVFGTKSAFDQITWCSLQMRPGLQAGATRRIAR